jgi:16S rRNA (guanine966-N2)-methyltransferase
MRIISGDLKGKKLFSLKGNATRPTADRVRESIFNICASKISDSDVLDLFAGTGAFALEALSRGAASAVFIDLSPDAVKIIDKNITACKMENRTNVIKWNIVKNLNCLDAKHPVYDLVFMDPPYNQNMILPALKNLVKNDSLKKDATIIIEHSKLEKIPEDLYDFNLTDHRKYGKTHVSFLTCQ